MPNYYNQMRHGEFATTRWVACWSCQLLDIFDKVPTASSHHVGVALIRNWRVLTPPRQLPTCLSPSTRLLSRSCFQVPTVSSQYSSSWAPPALCEKTEKVDTFTSIIPINPFCLLFQKLPGYGQLHKFMMLRWRLLQTYPV